MSLTIETARQKLRQLGFTDVEPLASGMEGYVFRLGDRKVAKVWLSKSVDEVAPLKHFYELLHTLALPFQTPLISQVEEVEGTTVSTERELPGTPMRELVREDERDPPAFALEAVLTVLSALKDKRLSSGESHLPILGITPSRQARLSGPTSALLEVADRKVGKYGDQLRRSVPDFDWLYRRTVHHLLEVQREDTQAVHGDLCPENFLLDAQGNVCAVLDWGFLSLFGDSALDASVACGVYNMYGPHHRRIDDVFLTTCEARLGYSRARLLLYRALYSIMSSNAYSEDGSDGQYAWCAENLLRDDLREVLSKKHIS